MNHQLPLTEKDRDKLKKAIKGSATALYVFSGITLIAALTVTIGFLLNPEAVWPSIASLFVALFAFGVYMSWRDMGKVKKDLQQGTKELVEGVIVKKTISRGNTIMSYDHDTLNRVALRVREEETGKTITRYGVLDSEIDQAVRHWYGLEINGENYNVGIQYYLSVSEGEQVSLEVVGKSRRVLSMRKM